MLLTTALVCAAFFAPEIFFTKGYLDFCLTESDIETANGAMQIGGFSILAMCIFELWTLAAILPLVTVFVYKKRRAQMRLLRFEFIVLSGCAVCLGDYLWTTYQSLPMVLYIYLFLLIPAILAIITNLLALRGVRRDERLVRSIDRIR
jgi:hypothetical protein